MPFRAPKRVWGDRLGARGESVAGLGKKGDDFEQPQIPLIKVSFLRGRGDNSERLKETRGTVWELLGKTLPD